MIALYFALPVCTGLKWQWPWGEDAYEPWQNMTRPRVGEPFVNSFSSGDNLAAYPDTFVWTWNQSKTKWQPNLVQKDQQEINWYDHEGKNHRVSIAAPRFREDIVRQSGHEDTTHPETLAMAKDLAQQFYLCANKKSDDPECGSNLMKQLCGNVTHLFAPNERRAMKNKKLTTVIDALGSKEVLANILRVSPYEKPVGLPYYYYWPLCHDGPMNFEPNFNQTELDLIKQRAFIGIHYFEPPRRNGCEEDCPSRTLHNHARWLYSKGVIGTHIESFYFAKATKKGGLNSSDTDLKYNELEANHAKGGHKVGERVVIHSTDAFMKQDGMQREHMTVPELEKWSILECAESMDFGEGLTYSMAPNWLHVPTVPEGTKDYQPPVTLVAVDNSIESKDAVYNSYITMGNDLHDADDPTVDVYDVEDYPSQKCLVAYFETGGRTMLRPGKEEKPDCS